MLQPTARSPVPVSARWCGDCQAPTPLPLLSRVSCVWQRQHVQRHTSRLHAHSTQQHLRLRLMPPRHGAGPPANWPPAAQVRLLQPCTPHAVPRGWQQPDISHQHTTAGVPPPCRHHRRGRRTLVRVSVALHDTRGSPAAGDPGAVLCRTQQPRAVTAAPAVQRQQQQGMLQVARPAQACLHRRHSAHRVAQQPGGRDAGCQATQHG